VSEQVEQAVSMPLSWPEFVKGLVPRGNLIINCEAGKWSRLQAMQEFVKGLVLE